MVAIHSASPKHPVKAVTRATIVGEVAEHLEIRPPAISKPLKVWSEERTVKAQCGTLPFEICWIY